MFIKDWKKDICSIPNLLSLLRLILIPVYVTIYLNARNSTDYYLAAGILAVSCLTDIIDGKIARQFNMISKVGKVLDPVADKLTQLSLMICLSIQHKTMRFLLMVFLIKEFFQFCAMIVSLHHGKALDGALMSGKISTTVLFGSLTIMVFCPNLEERTVNLLVGVSLVFLMLAFVDYVRAYYGKNKKIYDLE
jgi:cardiolipin synthase